MPLRKILPRPAVRRTISFDATICFRLRRWGVWARFRQRYHARRYCQDRDLSSNADQDVDGDEQPCTADGCAEKEQKRRDDAPYSPLLTVARGDLPSPGETL